MYQFMLAGFGCYNSTVDTQFMLAGFGAFDDAASGATLSVWITEDKEPPKEWLEYQARINA